MRWAAAGMTSLLMVLLSACNLPGRAASSPDPEATATQTPAPTVTPTWEIPEHALVAPNGAHYAVVREGGRLIVVSEDGTERELARAEEFTDLLWFPNSRHLAYVDRIPTDSVNPTLRERVWIADVQQAETHAIAPGFAPLLSPDGRYLAFMHGERAGDACIVAYGLGIVELNEQFVPVALIRQDQIAGIPASTDTQTFLPDVGGDRIFPGQWQDAGTLQVRMHWACQDEFGHDGLYAVDLQRREAEQLE